MLTDRARTLDAQVAVDDARCVFDGDIATRFRASHNRCPVFVLLY
jgi:hypothetical protein